MHLPTPESVMLSIRVLERGFDNETAQSKLNAAADAIGEMTRKERIEYFRALVALDADRALNFIYLAGVMIAELAFENGKN